MNKPYIIKKMYSRNGKKYSRYLGSSSKNNNLAYWHFRRDNAKTFTIDDGNKMVKLLENDASDGTRSALLVYENENAAKPKKNMNLYRIKEIASENFGYTSERWLQNVPAVTIAPCWTDDTTRASTFCSLDAVEMIKMLKDKRFIDYHAEYEVVWVNDNNVDDTVTAFDRASEVL